MKPVNSCNKKTRNSIICGGYVSDSLPADCLGIARPAWSHGLVPGLKLIPINVCSTRYSYSWPFSNSRICRPTKPVTIALSNNYKAQLKHLPKLPATCSN